MRPVIKHTISDCTINISPIASGWFICIKIILDTSENIYNIICKMTENSLFKILILGINDKEFLFFWCFKSYANLFLVYKTNIFIKLLKLMIIINYWIPLILFLIGCITFVSNRKHLLSILIRLEFIVLRGFLLIFLYLNYFRNEIYFTMIFLTFSVCEGALGLSILVRIIRTHGNDYFNSFRVLQC